MTLPEDFFDKLRQSLVATGANPYRALTVARFVTQCYELLLSAHQLLVEPARWEQFCGIRGATTKRRRTTASTGSSGLTHATVLAAGTAGELAKGAGAVLKGKAVQLAEGFQERMGQTIGGQVATAIRAGAAAEPPAFDGNSLAGEQAGNQAADPDDEVAAFVNRSTPA